jgi:hypothetical protein
LILLVVSYGRSLFLPFFFDDLVHIPFMEGHTLVDIWRTSGGLAYYRPLSFSIWKLMAWLMGRHDALAQHSLNLGLHLLNALLVAWLAGRLWVNRVWFRRFVAGSLFLLYPFSYQAIPWVGAMSHLAVTSLVLLSVVGYWRFRQGGGRVWAATSLLFAALAPFAHENGVLIGPLVAALEFASPTRQRCLRRVLKRGFLWSLPALAWFPIWWSAPKSADLSIPALGFERLWQNGVYFAQGVAYPVTWIGGWLHRQWKLDGLGVAAVLSTSALVLAAFVQVRTHSNRRLFPWLWCGLAVLPAVLTLKFDYVINGPRLLMIAGVGAVWLWTEVFALIFPPARSGDPGRIRIMLLLLAVASLGVQNLAFIYQRMTLHRQLGSGIEQVVDAALSAEKEGRPAVVVNFPSWFAPLESQYALGHEGVLVWPDYAQPNALVWVNSGRNARLGFVRWDPVRMALPIHYGVAGGDPDWDSLISARSQLFMARGEDQIQMVPVAVLDVLVNHDVPLASFSNDEGRLVVQLIEATAGSVADGSIGIDLVWQVGQVPSGVTVFVHLLDAEGQLVAQADGDPFGGLLALDRWPSGLVARDLRFADSPSAVTIVAGLYNRATGQRWPAISSTGSVLPNQAAPIPLAR